MDALRQDTLIFLRHMTIFFWKYNIFYFPFFVFIFPFPELWILFDHLANQL